MGKKVIAVSTIDQAELTIRLLEIGCKLKRPADRSGQQALADVREQVASGRVPQYIVDDFEAMALAAIEYFGECISSAQKIN
jgi:hypothetical protein